MLLAGETSLQKHFRHQVPEPKAHPRYRCVAAPSVYIRKAADLVFLLIAYADSHLLQHIREGGCSD